MGAFDVAAAQQRLAAANGGYEIVHESPRQQPHEDDEVYVVLEGSGVLNVAGEAVPLAEGQAAFVAAGVEHSFSAYEHLSVLVVFARR